MATSLLEAGKIQQKDYESIVEAILKREELGSTGIGRGVAVPHTKHPSIEKLIGTVAISSERRELRQPRWREGAPAVPARFAAGSPWRSLAGARKYLAPTARRHRSAASSSKAKIRKMCGSCSKRPTTTSFHPKGIHARPRRALSRVADSARRHAPPLNANFPRQPWYHDPKQTGIARAPGGKFVRLASQYESKIQLVRDGRRVEARNMIDLLTLGATQGTQLTLEADGPDAQAAVDALADLVETGFLQEDAEID